MPIAYSQIIGERLGPWQVEERIGAGGQGEVYRAVRADGVFEQTVAIKILRGHGANLLALRRFEREMENLAGLSHPYIASLLEAGTTADGRAWFAMEYVEGLPIDEFASELGLSVRDRLELFEKVCEAVSFAHRHLIAHLDLKPGNILVTAEGNPKLLDFGLARRLDTGASVADEPDAFSRAYASPEQVAPGRDLSTLSDVYSLGAVLYELLCGHLPIPVEGLSDAEAIHAICERTPTKPSEAAGLPRIVTGSDGRTFFFAPEKLGEMRGVTAGDLARRLRGDLDNITLTALRKEPGRRFPTVDEMARDIRRHLDGKRVHARPASGAYQAVRVAGRKPVLIVAAAFLASASCSNLWLPRQLKRTETAYRSSSARMEQNLCDWALSMRTQVAPKLEGPRRERMEDVVNRVTGGLSCKP